MTEWTDPDEAVESVALYALAYDAMFAFSTVGPRVNGSEIYEDLDTEHPTVSLLTMAASFESSWFFDAWDWMIVRAQSEDWLYGDEGRLAGLLPESEEWRVEAVLHALAAGGAPGWPRSLPAALALRIAERWEGVEEAMDRWRAVGITATHEDVEQTFLDAASAISGRARIDVYGELLSLRSPS